MPSRPLQQIPILNRDCHRRASWAAVAELGSRPLHTRMKNPPPPNETNRKQSPGRASSRSSDGHREILASLSRRTAPDCIECTAISGAPRIVTTVEKRSGSATDHKMSLTRSRLPGELHRSIAMIIERPDDAL